MSSPSWPEQRRRVLRRTAAVRARGGTNWLGVTTIVLDLGGVVVPTLFEVVDDPTFPRGPFGTDQLYAGVEQGRVQERDYWAALADARPDLDIGLLMRTRLAVREEVKAMLATVGGRVRVVALTNDMAHWFGPQWMDRFPEFTRFDLLLEAARSGVLKPDPAVFRWALAHLKEPAAKCLFVDDLPSNLAGAKAVGMNVELFDVTDPAGSVRRILDRVGIPPSNGTRRVFRP